MRALPRFGLFVVLALSTACSHQHAHGSHHRFDEPEKWAQRWDGAERDEWQKPAEVLEALQLPANAKVADLGAGTGYFTARLSRALPEGTVYAIDIEPSMVRYLEERAGKEGLKNVVPVLASQADPQLPSAVELVLIVNTYHHVSDRVAYFQRLAGRLAAKGRMAIVDYKKGIPHGPPDEEKLTPEQVVQEMTAAGYRLEKEHGFLPRQYFLVFERP